LQFMVLKGRSRDRIGKWLKRVDASVDINSATRYVVHEEEKEKEGMLLLHLFRDGREGATILLWIINFMNLLNLFFLSSWLPTVVRSAGYPTRVAVLVGTIGTFGLAWMIERRGFIPVLGGSFLLACLAIAVTGQPAHDAVCGGVHCRMVRGGRPAGRECAGGDLLSDVSAIDWDRLGFRDRAHRRDCGACGCRAVDRAQVVISGAFLCGCGAGAHFGSGDVLAALGD
jgi:AAHS family 4-hydroxybenzoate transporter-like MFS transporter